jgi:hypothetical protein
MKKIISANPAMILLKRGNRGRRTRGVDVIYLQGVVGTAATAFCNRELGFIGRFKIGGESEKVKYTGRPRL